MAPLHVASLGRQWPLVSAPFACATVENHIAAPVREFMLEVQIVFRLGARHDEDQVCHDRLRRIPDADLLQLGFTQRTDARATPGTPTSSKHTTPRVSMSGQN